MWPLKQQCKYCQKLSWTHFCIKSKSFSDFSWCRLLFILTSFVWHTLCCDDSLCCDGFCVCILSRLVFYFYCKYPFKHTKVSSIPWVQGQAPSASGVSHKWVCSCAHIPGSTPGCMAIVQLSWKWCRSCCTPLAAFPELHLKWISPGCV